MNLRKKAGLSSIITVLFVVAAININAAEWKVRMDKQAEAAGATTQSIPDGVELNIPEVNCKPYSIQVQRAGALKINCDYKLTFKAESSAAANVEIIYATAGPPHARFAHTKLKLKPEKNAYECTLKIRKTCIVKNADKRSWILRMYFGMNKNVNIKLTSFKISPLSDTSSPAKEKLSESEWRVAVDKQAKKAGATGQITEDGVELQTPKVQCKPYSIQIQRGGILKINCDYKLSFKAKASASANVEIVYTTAGPPHARFAHAKLKLEPGKTNYECTLKVRKTSIVKDADKRSWVLRMYFGANKNVNIKLTSFKISPLNGSRR